MNWSASDLWNFALRHLKLLRQPYGFAASDGETGIYNTLFGRDSLWTLLFLLEAQKLVKCAAFEAWLEAASKDIVEALVSHQGQRHDALTEEQPGKIIH